MACKKAELWALAYCASVMLPAAFWLSTDSNGGCWRKSRQDGCIAGRWWHIFVYETGASVLPSPLLVCSPLAAKASFLQAAFAKSESLAAAAAHRGKWRKYDLARVMRSAPSLRWRPSAKHRKKRAASGIWRHRQQAERRSQQGIKTSARFRRTRGRRDGGGIASWLRRIHSALRAEITSSRSAGSTKYCAGAASLGALAAKNISVA